MSSLPFEALRPTAVLLAVTAACAWQPRAALAQLAPNALPIPGVAIHGTAAFSQGGTATAPVLNITTTNGTGTSHSAINWQGFSIGSGAQVNFAQPSAASTSINRVLGSNPSQIFGTLSSNGKLVLVNPAGITVGTGAVIDTAGFTASTLAMCDADALAGAMNFLCGGNTGKLTVDGSITGTAGDVILVGPDITVGPGGSLVTQGGRVLLLAGEDARISERGLEGIVLTVKGGEKVANAGTLSGDAVGIFAASLTHSGFIQANAVDTADGKVVLRALAGDATVDGNVQAFASPLRNGGIEVSGDSVLGAGNYAADGGPVQLTAKTGSLRFGIINSNAFSGGAGGAVTLNAQADVVGQAIMADAFGGESGPGGKGGAIEVVSHAGNIHLAYASANGGSAVSGDGGDGGSIHLGALGTGPNAGSITIADPTGLDTAILSAHGGFGVGFTETGAVPQNGGKGGSIVVEAAHSISVGTTFADPSTGGFSSGLLDVIGGFAARGGQGGSIRLSAGGDLTMGGEVLATGGFSLVPGPDALGGAGGSISLNAGGSVTAGLVDASGGGILPVPNPTLAALPQTLPATTTTAVGGTGGAGGLVQVNAGGDVTAGGITATGGGSELLAQLGDFGAPDVGGAGGRVAITAGGKLTITPLGDGLPLLGVLANGGTGVTQGGAGGSISLARSAGDLVLDPATVLDARGGDGATGGAGGSLTLAANDGAIRLRSPKLFAAGGAGATASSNGAIGAFTAAASSVEIEGDLALDAAWNNSTRVSVTGASVAALAGPFNNLAGATLAGTGTLRLAGGAGTLTNSGTIAPGGEGAIGTLTLDGNLVMRSGSTLAVDVQSAARFDQLKVSGAASAEAGSRVLVNYLPAATLAPGDALAVVQAGSIGSALPQVAEAATTPRPAGVGGIAAASEPPDLVLTALAPSAPPPPTSPPPPPPPTSGEDDGQLSRPEVREVADLTTAFVQNFDRVIEQGRPLDPRERRKGRDDIVVTDTACKR
jgi:filamentous hemagglutinin family protein